MSRFTTVVNAIRTLIVVGLLAWTAYQFSAPAAMWTEFERWAAQREYIALHPPRTIME